MPRIIEIRTYQLKPNTRAVFHSLSQAARALQIGTDIVAMQPCLASPDSYCLIRAYASLAERDQSQALFYASAAWRDGPREAILACIDNFTSLVIETSEATIDGLRDTHNVSGKAHFE
jgi:NIPSNAP